MRLFGGYTCVGYGANDNDKCVNYDENDVVDNDQMVVMVVYNYSKHSQVWSSITAVNTPKFGPL